MGKQFDEVIHRKQTIDFCFIWINERNQINPNS